VSARAFLAFMGALALVALLGFGLASEGSGGVTVGEPPGGGELPPLDPTASADVSLADFEGEWVLANLWASWCEPCRVESPALERFARRNKGEVTVLGVNTQDNSDDALEFVDEFGLTYEQLHDGSGDFADELGATGVPETILVGPDGDVAFHVPGAVTEDVLRGQIEPLIRGDA
jgi:cytochrome c biogenesis protein CcmG, thiol:disulfide interchange protein DsbE